MIPIALFVLPPMLVLVLSGEGSIPSDEKIQKEQVKLLGYRYNETYIQLYKWRNMLLRPRFEVMAIGTSRVLKFRKEMFRKTFYNAGFMIRTWNDLNNFIDSLPDNKIPELLLLGLDQFLFNNELPVNYEKDKQINLSVTNKRDLFNPYVYIKVWQDLLSGVFDIDDLSGVKGCSNSYGIDALRYRRGFRSDGSMLYGVKEPVSTIPENALESKLESDSEHIVLQSLYFHKGKKINPQALEKLDQMLNKCSMKGIHVVAFLPPIRSVNYQLLKKQGQHAYMDSIFPSVNRMLLRYGFEAYDFTNPLMFDASDDMFLDELHGCEPVYQRILLAMIARGSSIRNYTVDSSKLNYHLNHPVSKRKIYPD